MSWWKRKRPIRITRDGVLYIVGICFAYYEIVIHEGPERPTVILFIAACIGLPSFLRKAEKDDDDKD